MRMWHSNTYRLESTLNYGLDRVWSLTCHKSSQQVAIGYDEGTIVISLGREDPAMSMDASGKLVCARHAELVQSNIRAITAGEEDSGDSTEVRSFLSQFMELWESIHNRRSDYTKHPYTIYIKIYYHIRIKTTFRFNES